MDFDTLKQHDNYYRHIKISYDHLIRNILPKTFDFKIQYNDFEIFFSDLFIKSQRKSQKHV